MIESQTVIANQLGLHARAAAKLVSTASRFAGETTITSVQNGMKANCKSIMGVMMLGASKGTKVIIKAQGSDASDALDALIQLINNKFDEQ